MLHECARRPHDVVQGASRLPILGHRARRVWRVDAHRLRIVRDLAVRHARLRAAAHLAFSIPCMSNCGAP
ncbi:hypothetical protein BN2476_350193 [Paraburkholderia piptadeniae]|uniref:Uncharacterized protein n=1 Tax=Paraburkholderia piptadeniae TaxID=1701573 RepID=A0A1N7S8B4_9BURK|nr:hypothetical protein BN2476_350193 [Paraburkholderia piptadeniae]